MTITTKAVYYFFRGIIYLGTLSKNKLEKNYYIFRFLKPLGLTSRRDDFDSIYFYTLYNISENKSKTLIQLFALKEVERAFEEQLKDGNDWAFQTEFVHNLHTNPKVRALKIENVNTEVVLNEFKKEFVRNINRARNPSEIELHNEIKEIEATTKLILERSNLNLSISPELFFYQNDIPDNVAYLTKRENVVLKCLDIIKKANWTLLSGGVGLGKTQLAILIAKSFTGNKIWISLRDLDSDQAFFKVVLSLSQSFNLKALFDISEWVKQLLKAIPNNTLIVLDDLPEICKEDNFSNLLINLCNSLPNGIKILSTCNKEISLNITEKLKSKSFQSETAPVLTDEEIEEILISYGAPQEFILSFKNFLASFSSRHPVILIALIRFMKAKNWKITIDEFSAIFDGKFTTELPEQIQKNLTKTIEDSDTRELLYRLNAVIGDFSIEEVKTVCEVFPPIRQPIEKFNTLIGLWVQKGASNLYQSSPLIKQLKTDNVNRDTLKNIYLLLGKRIFQQSKHSLGDARNTIAYFSLGKEPKDAAVILVQVLSHLVSAPKRFYDLGFNLFWYSTELDKKIPLFIRIHIRMQQIQIAGMLKKDTKFLLTDLENLVIASKPEGILYLPAYALLSGLYSLENPSKASKYFLEYLKYRELLSSKDLPEETREELDYFKKTVRIEDLVWTSCNKISTLEELEEWFDTFNKLNPEQIDSALKSEMLDVGCLSIINNFKNLEYNKKEEERDWSGLIKTFDLIEERARKFNIQVLIARAFSAKVGLLAEHFNSLDDAKKMAETHISTLTSETALFIVEDAIGRQLHYSNRDDDGLKFLAAAIVRKTDEFYTEKLDTTISLSQILGAKDSRIGVYYSEQALELTKNSNLYSAFQQCKAIGELSISYWFDNDRSKAIYTLIDGFEKLLGFYSDDINWKALTLKYGHVLGYLVQVFEGGKPPERIRNGEEYIAPYRGIFLNTANKESEKFYFKETNYSLTILALRFFEYVSDKNMILKWMKISLSIYDETSPKQFSLLLVNIIPYLVSNNELQEAVRVCTMIIDNMREDDSALSKRTPEFEVHRKNSDSFITSFSLLSISIGAYKRIIEDSGNKVIIINDLLLLLNYWQNNSRVSLMIGTIIQVFEQLKNDGESFDSLVEIGNNYSGPEEREIKTIAYLAASLFGPTRLSLKAQLNVIPFICEISKAISPSIKSFILFPFLLKYWEIKMKKEAQDFKNIEILQGKINVQVHGLSTVEDLKLFCVLLINATDTQINENIFKWLNSK